jgi:hypothetical protein
MGKFRKRPVVVDAFQWTGDHDQTEDPDWIVDALRSGDAVIDRDPLRMRVITIHGEVAIVRPGDWVICEPELGRFYPCKPEVFAATYEPEEAGHATRAEAIAAAQRKILEGGGEATIYACVGEERCAHRNPSSEVMASCPLCERYIIGAAGRA